MPVHVAMQVIFGYIGADYSPAVTLLTLQLIPAFSITETYILIPFALRERAIFYGCGYQIPISHIRQTFVQ